MDRSLFATLWAGIEHRLRTYLAACVMDQDQVDDLVQRVALACWRKRDAFQEGQDFLAWVLGFARLEVLRGRRDRARDRHVLDEDLLATLESDLSALVPELDQRHHALEWCRAGLDGRARDLVEMAYGKSLPLAAVARKVGSSHAAVRTALCRIRDRLRECVERRLAGGEV
ncbi:MAG: sigma-70 family RNA polymerase sigma factor [Planctomycetota bacterium]|nr:sigma-70 family RNA polymerase sigma factor [Planctomycetota bacterium]